MKNTANSPPMHRDALRFRASQLINCEITNSRNEELGSIQDIVLASDNRQIVYVVVAFGGFLGMGEKFFAMPWRVISVSRNDDADASPRIELAVDQEMLETAPGFEKDNWPDMAATSWSRQVDQFYGHRGATSDSSLGGTSSGGDFGRDPDGEAFHFRRVSELLDMAVVDDNDDSLATVDDLIVDAEQAEIIGAALSFGGVMGMGKDIALVPLDSMTLDRRNDNFVLPCTTTDLQAMTLPNGEWSAIDNNDWLSQSSHRRGDGVSESRSERGSAATWEK